MNHIGLFAGIGGFELAAAMMGWQTIAWCEINPFCQTVLKYHFPHAKAHSDIKATDFSIYRGQCDLLTGGFPCQPYSVAGQRKGTADDRHLWPEMLRAIREIQPTWIVGENVSGLTNWNGGMVFNQVQADLEVEGYEVTPFLLPAASVNAPHKRDRIWFVAYSSRFDRSLSVQQRRQEQACNAYVIGQSSERITSNAPSRRWSWFWRNKKPNKLQNKEEVGPRVFSQLVRPGSKWFIANTNSRRCGDNQSGWANEFFEKNISSWRNFPTQSPLCDGDDGFSTESLRHFLRKDSNGLLSEKEIDKIISKAATEWRNESLKSGGNAIVPQVALQIYKAIKQYQQTLKVYE